MYQHYGKKVIVLVDEYDVPLDKAYQKGFYNEMVSVMRLLFSKVFKTNGYMEFAVLTGCLRVSRESIFTGLNNFDIKTISDNKFSEYFGFTNEEVKDMLEYYGLEDKYGLFKEWYNGYRFGNTEVYCPWDVINQCESLKEDKDAVMKTYWVNSSVQWEEFCMAVAYGDALKMENLINWFLFNNASIRDTYYRKDIKENFYHGFLLQTLSINDLWYVRSNAESGEGYPDILVEDEKRKRGFVFELKYAEEKEKSGEQDRKLVQACEKAIQQVKDNDYTAVLRKDGMETIYIFGVAFCRKKCKIICEKGCTYASDVV